MGQAPTGPAGEATHNSGRDRREANSQMQRTDEWRPVGGGEGEGEPRGREEAQTIKYKTGYNTGCTANILVTINGA